jgi:dTDP-4-dehydrorhamnose reductase
MKALVLGAKGTLGQALAGWLSAEAAGGGWQVTALGRDGCDVADPAAVARTLGEVRPDVIFNAGAYTNVDRAEDEPEAAYRANALAPELLARAAGAIGAKLVHYSTDFVFDGELDRAYDEFDVPSPQGIYARSKLAGERLAAAASARVFILRVGCLYGRNGRNFPSTMRRRIQAGETIRAERDRLGSPTWVRDVARVSEALARTDAFGLYHCTSGGETTWVDYARFLAEELGHPGSRVEALPPGGLALKAPRPRRAILDNRMLRLRGLDLMPDWRDAARAFLADEAQDEARRETKEQAR